MVDEHEPTIPVFIVTQWGPDGEPATYKAARQCTVEEIRAQVDDLRRKVRALHEQIAHLAVYVTDTMERVDDMRAATREVPRSAACASREQEQAHGEQDIPIDATGTGVGDGRRPGARPGAIPSDGPEPDAG
jgi:chemotaxis response regulator CheB